MTTVSPGGNTARAREAALPCGTKATRPGHALRTGGTPSPYEEPRALFVGGEAGVGTTRLLREFLGRAAADLAVVAVDGIP
ncbi:hypothetical protein [Streptomyces flavofungini]|uniref:hypothetical protein n=1 Tax=Streptomyces flavofungini TaxID=68200 RepID=UPI0034DEE46F